MKKYIFLLFLVLFIGCGTQDRDARQRTPNPPDTTDTEANTF